MQSFSIQCLKKDQPVSAIMSFTGTWLSNFHECNIHVPAERLPNGSIIPGASFSATESAYMAWKVTDTQIREKLAYMAPSEAKEFSQTPEFKAVIRSDYTDTNRLRTMLMLNRLKYSADNPLLLTKLLDTEGALLVEGNTWDDTFFGFCLKTGTGHNYLGRILMTIRDEIRIKADLEPFLQKPILPEDVLAA